VDKWVAVTLDHKVQGGSIHVTPVFNTLANIQDAALKAWPAWGEKNQVVREALKSRRDTENDIRNQEDRLAKAKDKDKPGIQLGIDALKGQLPELDKRVEKAQAEVQSLTLPVKGWIEVADRVINARENATLTIRDLWGVPVATLTFKFQPCDPAELIWAKQAPETKPAGK
jgi:seryl-tRNA synthetase